jgi:hypothetical protein
VARRPRRNDKLGLRLPPIALPRPPIALGKLVDNATTLLTGWHRHELLSIIPLFALRG